MAMFDEPNISVTKKTNEENIATIKSYLSNLADSLNYIEQRLTNVEDFINSLESEES